MIVYISIYTFIRRASTRPGGAARTAQGGGGGNAPLSPGEVLRWYDSVLLWQVDAVNC